MATKSVVNLPSFGADQNKLIKPAQLQPKTDEEMMDIDKRYASFPDFWPKYYPEPQQCALSGFYFSGKEGGYLHCVYCGFQTRLLFGEHDPFSEHARVSPSCSWVACPDIRTEETPKDAVLLKKIVRNRNNPLNVNMESERDRLRSFEPPRKWTGKQSSVALVKAGFFFCGVDDRVQCFHCGGILENWNDQDDPFVEHTKAFPSCEFMRRSLGDSKVQKLNRESLQRECDEAGRFASMALQRNYPSVKTLLSMGFNIDSIRYAIQTFSSKQDSPIPTVAQLVDTILQHGNYPNKMDKDELSDERLCMFCCACERQIVFVPCGHMISCTSCSKELCRCPICRANIDRAVTVFYS